MWLIDIRKYDSFFFFFLIVIGIEIIKLMDDRPQTEWPIVIEIN